MVASIRLESAEEKAEYNFAFVWTSSVVAALGGMLFGYDWVVIGGAKPFFERYFELKDATVSGWANSCALLGCLAGAVVAGHLSDRFGRKRLLVISALLFATTSICNALASTFGLFVFWRILGGVAIGFASNLSPLYIAELAPAHLRGRLVSVNQLTIVLGILLAQLANWYLVRDLPAGATDFWIAKSWYGQVAWRWMFALTAIPSLFFFLGMLFVPESPRWLAARGRFEEAGDVLKRVGGAEYARVSLVEIRATLNSDASDEGFRGLFVPRMRRVIVLGVVLAIFQQWCGINTIFNYAEEIFRAAGYDISSVLRNIAWTGSVNLVFTLVAFGIVDRLGRRPLMLFGSAGLAVIYAVMGVCYYFGVKGLPMLLLVLGAIACFAVSLAPVTWVIISEVFPNRIRGAGVALAVGSLWIACFIVTFLFPILNQFLGPSGTFWLYACICVAGFLFVRRRLPETKGKSLEELERELVK